MAKLLVEVPLGCREASGGVTGNLGLNGFRFPFCCMSHQAFILLSMVAGGRGLPGIAAALPWTNTMPGVRQEPHVAIAALRRPEGLLDTGLPC